MLPHPSFALKTFPGNHLICVSWVASPLTCSEDVTSPLTCSEDVTSPLTCSEDVTSPLTGSEDVTSPLTCSEDVAAAVTARGEVVVVTVGAVKLLVLGGERLVDERVEAVAALEAFLVPVLVLVRQVLKTHTRTFSTENDTLFRRNCSCVIEEANQTNVFHDCSDRIC